jgi:hypothetical protein
MLSDRGSAHHVRGSFRGVSRRAGPIRPYHTGQTSATATRRIRRPIKIDIVLSDALSYSFKG